MEYLVGSLVAAWILYLLWQGYQAEVHPPPKLTVKDNGSGVMEPVCEHCQAKLVSVTRKTGSGLVATLAILVGLIGVVLILFNWIAGGILLILAILISSAGKSQQTVLTCPACGKDAKRLA